MTRFALATVVGSARRLLAVTIAVVAITGTAYLGSHKLSKHGDYAYGSCGFQSGVQIVRSGDFCGPPTRGAWQVPLALVIAVLGLGAAVAVAGRPWRPTHEDMLSGLDV
jgi:hypothetical protein